MDSQHLKDALQTPSLSNKDKLLVLLFAAGGKPQKPQELRAIAVAAGLKAIKDWNVTDMLSKSKGRAIPVKGGWELTSAGKTHVTSLGFTGGDQVVVQQATALRALLPMIKTEENRAFIAEAVSCYEHKNLRAAVVLSWIGAVAILYDDVVAKHLSAFSADWVKRNPQKNKPVTNINHLSDIKEHDFLDILHSISVIGKSVKEELKACLKFRNGCGHPNNLVVGETRVAGHLETLINNVYLKFS